MSLFNASSESEVDIKPHVSQELAGAQFTSSSEGFKLCTQLNWAGIAVWHLEEPPELTGILGSHLTQAPAACFTLLVTDVYIVSRSAAILCSEGMRGTCPPYWG